MISLVIRAAGVPPVALSCEPLATAAAVAREAARLMDLSREATGAPAAPADGELRWEGMALKAEATLAPFDGGLLDLAPGGFL